jgi:hypothetical protein
MSVDMIAPPSMHTQVTAEEYESWSEEPCAGIAIVDGMVAVSPSAAKRHNRLARMRANALDAVAGPDWNADSGSDLPTCSGSSLQCLPLPLDEVIMNTDSRVDDYISRLPDWQQAICQQVRQLVHDADPEVQETVKRSVLPYFVLQGNVCALLAAKDHVNVFIYDPIVPDPHGVINQGHGNATARAVQIYRGDLIDQPALLEIFRAVIDNNRAGGWRRIQAGCPS